MSQAIQGSITILFVTDQARSKDFYRVLLGHEPSLDVDGMTEFTLHGNMKLGLMPQDNIVKILNGGIPHPANAGNIPKAEIYLYVENPGEYSSRLSLAGGACLSEAALRPWGDIAAYGLDPDGHVLAFARHPGD